MNSRSSLAASLVVAGAVLAFAGPARADLFLSMTADDPGPYVGGETVNVDVFLENDGEGLMPMRVLQIDTANTDPALGIGDFAFDTSSLIDPSLYADFSGGTVTSLVYTSTLPAEGLILEYGEGTNYVTTIPVTLPTDPGEYRFDIAHATAPDMNTGALFMWGFDPPQTAWAGSGVFPIQAIIFTVPEPSLLVLCGAGSLVALRRRRLRAAAGGGG